MNQNENTFGQKYVATPAATAATIAGPTSAGPIPQMDICFMVVLSPGRGDLTSREKP